MLIGTGIVIAGFTLAMMLVMAIDSALYIMGGILVALSIPLMLMTTVVKSLVLRRASFTSRPWQAYNTKSAELELTSSDLTFSAKCFRHAYIFLYRAGGECDMSGVGNARHHLHAAPNLVHLPQTANGHRSPACAMSTDTVVAANE